MTDFVSMRAYRINWSNFRWMLTAAGISLMIGFIHHRWLYPIFFHGDGAAIQVLGSAVLQEKSILPADFYYGNQLLLYRAEYFIALALGLGISGYDAYVLGSAMTVGAFGLILYGILLRISDSPSKAVLFVTILLIPLGHFDFEFVLGQQSHLANCIFAFGFGVFLSKWMVTGRGWDLLAAILLIFLLSIEAPIRGELVLGPFLIILLCSGLSRPRVVGISGLGAALVIGVVLNKLLQQARPLAVNYNNLLYFHSLEEISDKLGFIFRDLLGGISILGYLSGIHLTFPSMLAACSTIMLLVGYTIRVVGSGRNFFAFLQRRIGKSFRTTALVGWIQFFEYFFFVGAGVGLLAVLLINPDSARHMLWAMFIGKFLVLWFLYEILVKHVSKVMSGILILTGVLVASSWGAVLLKHGPSLPGYVAVKANAPEIKGILEIGRKFNIKQLYGMDFWQIMPLNVYLPGMEAQPLERHGDILELTRWLGRKSWACGNGDVLYLVKKSVEDDELLKRLVISEATLLAKGQDFSIWKGVRVWKKLSTDVCP